MNGNGNGNNDGNGFTEALFNQSFSRMLNYLDMSIVF